MRILSTPQALTIHRLAIKEDYVAMGYNATKALIAAEKLEYILAIELLSVYEAQPFVQPGIKRGKASAGILAEIGKKVPVMENDMFPLSPYRVAAGYDP